MLFSKKNFRQFFSGRPSRRRAGYSVPAQVQTLQSKVLLSAGPVEVDETSYDETMTDETSYDETMTDETSTDETMTDETSTDETMTDETSYDETMTDETSTDDENLPWIGTVSVNAVNGELKVSGQVEANGGDLSGLSLEWGDGVSGEGLSIDGETGEITGTLSTGTTGSVLLRLMRSVDGEPATEIDTAVLTV